MTPEAFASAYDVSRETLARLKVLAECLRRWTPRINLVAPGTLPDLWSRHIADSAQLFALRPHPCRSWLDLGSGAGFPGLVIAAMAAEQPEPLAMTLVESDQRKAAFLAAAAHEMGLSVRIEARRAETLSLPPPDVLSARALAPLPALLALAEPLAGPLTTLLFPKGVRADSELTEARGHWHIECQEIASRTDPGATILRISRIERRHAIAD